MPCAKLTQCIVQGLRKSPPIYHIYETETLPVQQMPQFKQKILPRKIIKPIYSLQIVTSTEFCPNCSSVLKVFAARYSVDNGNILS